MTALEYKQLYETEKFRENFLCVREDFGAVYTKEKTSFHVWAPAAEQVKVALYTTGTDEEAGACKKAAHAMNNIGNGVWELEQSGDLKGLYYTYLVTRDGVTKECIDIHARACGANGKRGMILDLRDTDPPGFGEDKGWIQNNPATFIYELHIKDFSYHAASGIAEEYRGKYLAFTQQGTTLWGKGEYKTGIDYLKDLGITHVHLLPAFDFASVDELGGSDQFNWGYDPMNYNIPEGSYATDSRKGEVRIREFKQMVKALHDAGIGVIMDVVYNHTYSHDSAFQTLAPYYYYRQKENGAFSDGSACGNETASERFMFRQFMLQSVLYWVKEYHIDGFRFDLMGLHDTGTLNLIRKTLNLLPDGEKILLYGEPWIADASCMEKGYVPAVKENISYLDEGISIFCDDTRDTIKGSVFYAQNPGFVNGKKGMEEKMRSAVQAWCDGGHEFTPKSPAQIITYVSAHDNYTLWDKLALTMQKEVNFETRDELLLSANRLTASILFTSLGTPFIQAGEEFARTKLGDENSYCSSARLNCLDWERMAKYRDLVEYYKGLAALRAQFGAYAAQSMESLKKIRFYDAEEDVVAFEIDADPGTGSRFEKLFIVYNSNTNAAKVKLPDGKWQLLSDGKCSWLWKNTSPWSKIIGKGRNVEVGGLSAVIYGRRARAIGGDKMDFLEKVGGTLATKGKDVADKAKDMAEIVSLKNQISICEDVIKKNYMEIGKRYYEENAGRFDDPYEEQLTAVRNAENGIKDLEERIKSIKGV